MRDTFSNWPNWQKIYVYEKGDCLPLPLGYIHVYYNSLKRFGQQSQILCGASFSRRNKIYIKVASHMTKMTAIPI